MRVTLPSSVPARSLCDWCIREEELGQCCSEPSGFSGQLSLPQTGVILFVL